MYPGIAVADKIDFLNREVPVSLPPPLIRLCRVWVDADSSVTVSDGCIGLLHLDVDTDRGGTITVIKTRRADKETLVKIFIFGTVAVNVPEILCQG